MTVRSVRAAAEVGGGLPAHRSLAAHVESGDPPADDDRLESLADRLDLRKLRHPPRAAARSPQQSPLSEYRERPPGRLAARHPSSTAPLLCQVLPAEHRLCGEVLGVIRSLLEQVRRRVEVHLSCQLLEAILRVAEASFGCDLSSVIAEQAEHETGCAGVPGGQVDGADDGFQGVRQDRNLLPGRPRTPHLCRAGSPRRVPARRPPAPASAC